MSDIPRITSMQNPQVKHLVKLRDRRVRDSEGLTIIEEPRVIRRARHKSYPFHTVYFCPEQLFSGEAADLELLAELRRDAEAGKWDLVELAPHVMSKVSYRDQPAGMLVMAPQSRSTLADLKLPAAPLLVILDGLQKPGNLGGILRTADAAAADAVIICGLGTDIFNPNVLRASTGAFFSVPTVETEAAEVRRFLQERGIRIVATTPDATEVYSETDLSGPTALVMGAEDRGLDAAWLDRDFALVKIPMQGEADSLNVGVAAAVVLFEAVRQRGATGKE